MSVVILEPPEPYVSLALTKAHLRVLHDEDDALIGAYILAACRHLDGPNTWLGYAIGEQLVEVRQSSWCDLDPLPCQPLIGVESINYVSADGAEAAVPEEDYRVTARGIEFASHAARPALRGDSEGVRIICLAGHVADSPTTVPEDIIVATLLLIGHWYANRETVVPGVTAVSLPMATEALLEPYVNWSR